MRTTPDFSASEEQARAYSEVEFFEPSKQLRVPHYRCGVLSDQREPLRSPTALQFLRIGVLLREETATKAVSFPTIAASTSVQHGHREATR
jgi:hypothetical protein